MQYLNKSVKSLCPVCSELDAVVLWSVNSSEAATHFVSRLEDVKRHELLAAHIGKLWNFEEATINECNNCSFIYSYPYVGGDKTFYDLAYQRSGYPKWKWEFEKAFETISASKIENPKVLEIGAGNGAFLRQLVDKDLLTKDSITAIEFSDYGRNKILEMGITCLSTDIRDEKLILPHKEYDFICLFQVLEHMDDLTRLITCLLKNLSSDGRLILAVPNNKFIEFNELNGALLDMPPNHIGRWNPHCFSEYSNLNGLVVLERLVEPLSRIASVKQFFQYRLLKRIQNANGIDASLRYQKNRIIGWLGLRISLVCDILTSPRLLWRLLENGKKFGGESQYISLGRQNN